ncbi:hypothetical protein C8Q74DRAFT_1214605 [Fomes fomentarius]|nr:hypothetical protein C8Q74DRAFT_1214605 [Fomes fomentarius]
MRMDLVSMPYASKEPQLLYGTTYCTYEVSIDGDDLLQKPTEVIAQNGRYMIGRRSLVLWQMGNATPRLPPSTTMVLRVPKPVPKQATNPDFVKYTGNWTQRTESIGHIPSKMHPTLRSDGRPGFTIVRLPMICHCGHWAANMGMDREGTTTHNDSTMWLIGDRAVLPRRPVTIEPAVGDGFEFWLNSVTIYGGANDITGMGGGSTVGLVFSRAGSGRDRGPHQSGNRGSLCNDRSRNRTLSAQATSCWPRETAPVTPYAVPESGINSGNPHSMAQMGGAPLSAPERKHVRTRAAVCWGAGRPRDNAVAQLLA